MGIYSKYILPRLINKAMQGSEIDKERKKYVPRARGVVLEIGGGSGANIPFYKNIEKLIILEPSKELLKFAAEKMEGKSFPIEILNTGAEKIPLADNSIDSVVSTWTLCSIPDVKAALLEIKRVLKPGGTFIFVEHGYSPNPTVAKWQTRITPIWKHFAGGCHLDRKIDELIKHAGLSITELRIEFSEGLKTAGYFYKGEAKKG